MDTEKKTAACTELRKMHKILQLGASLTILFVVVIIGSVGFFLYTDFRLTPDELDKLSKNTHAVVLFVSARFFVVLFASIVCALLIGVIRYNVLLSNYWLSRAFALELMQDDESLSANDLVRLLSPEKIEFLSSRQPVSGELANILKKLQGMKE